MKSLPGSYTMWLLEKRQHLLATVNGHRLIYTCTIKFLLAVLASCLSAQGVSQSHTTPPAVRSSFLRNVQHRLLSANQLKKLYIIPRPKEGDICLLFNRGQYSFPVCKFCHMCLYCSGRHPASQCKGKGLGKSTGAKPFRAAREQ